MSVIDLRSNKQNPWANIAPSLLQAMVMAKIQQKMRLDEMESQAYLAQTTRPSDREGYDTVFLNGKWEYLQQKDDRTDDQREFDRYKKDNPEYAGDFVQFKQDTYKKSAESDKTWIHNPQQKIKRQVPKSEVDSFLSQGWQQGLPYGASEKQKDPRLRLNDYVNSYGAPRNTMGQIMMMDPKQRRERLSGWIRSYETEKKAGILSEKDLETTNQRILTELGIDQRLQGAVIAAQMAGATSQELIKLIQSYER